MFESLGRRASDGIRMETPRLVLPTFDDRAFDRFLSYFRPILPLVLISLAARIVIAAIAPFASDEAYAVVVSRDHAWSYYDHPALSFAIARLMADLSGSEAHFCLRFPFVLMGTASQFVLFDLTSRLYGRRAGFWAAAAFSCAPFFVFSTQLAIEPDAPLDLCLLACLRTLLPALTEGKPSVRAWLAGGAFLALALLSKYQAVLFAAAVLGTLLVHVEWRRRLLSWPAFLGMMIAATGLVPTLIWNADHGWASFAFQSQRAYVPRDLAGHMQNLVTVLAGQAFYLLPPTWFLCHRLALQALRGGDPIDCLLAVIAVVPIGLFDLIAAISHGSLPHWAMSGFLFAFPLIGRWRSHAPQGQFGGIRLRLRLAFGLVMAGLLLVSLQASTALLTRPFYQYTPSFDVSFQLSSWSKLSAAIPSDDGFVLAPNWIEAGQMGLALGPSHPISILTDPHHFQFMQGSMPTKGYYVSAYSFDQYRKLSPVTVPDGYAQIGPAHGYVQDRMSFPSFVIEVIPVRKTAGA